MATQIQDSQSPETPRTASADAILVKISDIIANNGRIRIKQIAKVGISSGTAFKILKKHPGLKKVSAGCEPRLSKEKQNRLRVEM